jgi:hypothetical protein
MILAIASMGTKRMAPGIPHIQNQQTSDKMTRTGLRVKSHRQKHRSKSLLAATSIP